MAERTLIKSFRAQSRSSKQGIGASSGRVGELGTRFAHGPMRFSGKAETLESKLWSPGYHGRYFESG